MGYKAARYKTDCPKCGGQLFLESCTVYPTKVMIREDGFDLAESKGTDTEKEIVSCEDCGWAGDLEMEDDDVG